VMVTPSTVNIFFFFFFNQKFITRGSLTVHGRHIQTIRKLRLRYALTVMYYQNLNAVSGRQMQASPQVSMNDVALSSRVCSRALTTGPAPTATRHQIALIVSPNRNPTQGRGSRWMVLIHRKPPPEEGG
jgi:ribosomal protein L30/L7E